MNEKFCFGLIIGALGGMLVVANSVKARKAVVNGQEQVTKKIEDLSKEVKQKTAKTSTKKTDA